MSQRVLLSLAVALVACFPALADNKAQIELLHMQIKQLRAEEKVVIKALQEKYRLVFNNVQRSEDQLIIERDALKAQEDQILALTTDPAQRKLVREEYALLIKALRTDVKLEKQEIAALKKQEHAQVQRVRELYVANIKALEQTIKQLHGAKK